MLLARVIPPAQRRLPGRSKLIQHFICPAVKSTTKQRATTSYQHRSVNTQNSDSLRCIGIPSPRSRQLCSCMWACQIFVAVVTLFASGTSAEAVFVFFVSRRIRMGQTFSASKRQVCCVMCHARAAAGALSRPCCRSSSRLSLQSWRFCTVQEQGENDLVLDQALQRPISDSVILKKPASPSPFDLDGR